jgi:peptidoglycan hydrolase-like protein with peptidoglycan-binding domain
MKKTILTLVVAVVLVAPTISLADTAAASSFAHLGLGSRGTNVTALQTLLATDATIYPEGTVSGYLGQLTVKAIKRFQLKNGLTQTGAVGPLTLIKLQALLAVTQSPTTIPSTPVTTPTPPATTTVPTTPAATTTPVVATTTPTTPAPAASTDTTAPSISYISALNPTNQSSSVINIIWNTNEMATTKVYFSTATPIVLATASSTAVSGLSYQHAVTISGLQYNTGYNFVIESADAAGNKTQTQSQTFHTTN